jgi:hypothetical protein
MALTFVISVAVIAGGCLQGDVTKGILAGA